MYIKWVEIENFRGIKEGTIKFKPGMNILIGPSNVGKSTVLRAIELTLNPYIPWYRRDVLNEFDFYKANIEEPIRVTLMIGCGRKRCHEGEDVCDRFEVGGEETCRLRTIAVDRITEKVLKEDDIESSSDFESCVMVKMEAKFEKEEGYAEVEHNILNEDGDTWMEFNRTMKEWIGVLLLDTDRDPRSESKLQYKSLLSRAIGDVTDWEQKYLEKYRKELKGIVQDLAGGQAKDVLQSIAKRIDKILPIIKGQVNIGIEGANKRDLTRQVELCYRQIEGFELPLSRHGKGLQNVAALILGVLALGKSKELRPPCSVVMVEEPEQNLEPQMQRSVIRFINEILKEKKGDSQVIMTTHSPHVLIADLDLESVIKLQAKQDGKLEGLKLGEIEYRGNHFFRIRKKVEHDSELFESLFGELAVVWEGDSEAGFYPTVMRRLEDYPEEMLAGINGQGSNFHQSAGWLKKGGYDVIVVLDGDKNVDLDRLYRNGINFVALPKGKNMDHILTEELLSIEESVRTEVMIKAIGASGEIYKSQYLDDWPELIAVFQKHDEVRKLSMEKVLEEIEKGLILTGEYQKIFNILDNFKQRYVREALAEALVEKSEVPEILVKVLEHLRTVWTDRSQLGQYQLDKKGELRKYLPQG